MENYPHHSHPRGSFDVQWRHFQPRLSISSPGHDGPQQLADGAASVFPLYSQAYRSLGQQPSTSQANPQVRTL